jgi:electron transport complex protein RnfE
VFYSALDGFANGLGFTAVLLFIGGVREIIGKGTLFSGMDQLIGESGRNLQINLFSADDGLLIAILPPGAFITLGLLVAAKNYLDNRLYIKNSSKKRDSESTIVTE